MNKELKRKAEEYACNAMNRMPNDSYYPALIADGIKAAYEAGARAGVEMAANLVQNAEHGGSGLRLRRNTEQAKQIRALVGEGENSG